MTEDKQVYVAYRGGTANPGKSKHGVFRRTADVVTSIESTIRARHEYVQSDTRATYIVAWMAEPNAKPAKSRVENVTAVLVKKRGQSALFDAVSKGKT